MNYNLRRVPPPVDLPGNFDLFGQIAALETTWRKKLMKNAIDGANVIPGTKDRRVLNFAERENQKPIPDVTTRHDSLDAMWKCKARQKPLIDHGSFTIKLERSRISLPESIDWGARNFLAMVIDTSTDSSVVIFNADTNNAGAITRPGQTIVELRNRVHAIKWNHAGDRIAMVTNSSKLKVHSMEKYCWSQKCPCADQASGKRCIVDCVAWTHDDKEIAICCRESRMTAFSYSGKLIQSKFIKFNKENTVEVITSISFSPNDNYFAVTGFSALIVYTWPSMALCFEIDTECRHAEKPMAWHPWNANVMCVGGFPSLNSLSLWDVQRRRPLGFTKAPSVEQVDDIAWNKLSGELVVRWNYWVDDHFKWVVTVLASPDRVVDALYETYQSSGLVWNPDSTLLATRRRSQVKIWKFFGDVARKWSEPEQKRTKLDSLKRRRDIYTDQTIHLEHHDIR